MFPGLSSLGMSASSSASTVPQESSYGNFTTGSFATGGSTASGMPDMMTIAVIGAIIFFVVLAKKK